MITKEEKKRKVKSWTVAIMIQIIMLLTFYFLVAWKEPFPPIPSYGIELGFIADVSAPQVAANSQSEPSEEIVEEVNAESSKDMEELAEPEAVVEESVETTEATESEETFEETLDESSPVESSESPMPAVDQVEDKQEELPEVVKPEPEKPAQTEEEQEANKPENTSTSDDKASEENDDGEDDKTVESVPTENPSLDNRAIYGTTLKAGDQGASLQLSGWGWDNKPKPIDKSDENGRIEYEIKVDADGYLISIQVISSTVSPSVERIYRESIERLTFSKTNDYRPAPFSSGKVTFIITTK